MPDDRLRKTVELMHGGKATFVQFVPVRETFGGDTVWEGAVRVFDLAGIRPQPALTSGNHLSRAARSDNFS
jgi:hypothetical protein